VPEWLLALGGEEALEALLAIRRGPNVTIPDAGRQE
jgi:hypothetical protein